METIKPPVFLLVDDDSDDRLLFDCALRNINKTVTLITVENGKRLIKLLSDNTSQLPDVIFLDINMPEVDGWESLIYMKNNERLKSIPVVMYSTSESKQDIEKAHKLGACCFCTKPFLYDDLVKLLQAVYSNLKNLKDGLNENKFCSINVHP